jgi:nicotinate-nucleotide--dimethylbenzimidazole phosphoribosyltransferase
VIRFSASLVAVAVGVLIAGIVSSSLKLVYVAIGISAVALIAVLAGAARNREELFGGNVEPAGQPAPELAGGADSTPVGAAAPVSSQAGGFGGFGDTRAFGAAPADLPPVSMAPAAGPRMPEAPPGRWTGRGVPGAAPAMPPVPEVGRHKSRPAAYAPPSRSAGYAPPVPPAPPAPPAPVPAVPPVPEVPAAAAAAVVPETATPEVAVAATAIPEAMVPEAVVPEAVVPEAVVPEAVVPEAVVPEAVAPETAMAEVAAPEVAVPDVAVPDVAMPEVAAPEAEAAGVGTPGDEASHSYVHDVAATESAAVLTEFEVASEPDAADEAAEADLAAATDEVAEAGTEVPEAGTEVGDTMTAAGEAVEESGAADVSAGDEEAVADEAPAASETAAPSVDLQRGVTVVPGVPRYHNAQCILIRFMGEDDLERTTLGAARESGLTPCRACQPDQEAE